MDIEFSKDRESLSLRAARQKVIWETEVTFIKAVLDLTDWNRRAAAEILKISYRGLLYKIKEYGIKKPKKEEDL